MKSNTLNSVVWKYFLLFSIIILFFLWLFQVLFFDKFYKYNKINDAVSVAKTIINNKDSNDLKRILDDASIDKEVCIELSDDGAISYYKSNFRGKGCLIDNVNSFYYKADFINSNKDTNSYEILNKNFNNETYVYAVRLNNNNYAFINTSIEPLGDISNILTKQLYIITILLIILSFIVSYYISKKISKPIVDISNNARKFANGDNKVSFDTNTNITEINELVDSLNYSKDELSKTDELRRDLMANVSHDLKTPLTMIKAYAELSTDLHANNLDKQKEDMSIVTEEVERLSILVNDILDLSKLQSNVCELDITEFDLIDLINNILKRYEFLEELDNYKFKFIHKNKKLLVKADMKKLEQVIYNLINNAINYTGDDNIVTIKVIVDNDIKVEITDTGKGIKEEDIPYIWNKYYKNKKKHKRNVVGTGLGLSIVKEILEAHDYKYGVDSKEGSGTTFYFYIKKM